MRRISEIGLKRKLTKILSGEVKCKVGNKEFYIRSPSLSQIYESEVIYQELCCDAQLIGVLSDEELLDYMIKNGLWAVEQNEELNRLPKVIEDLKLSVWNFYANFHTKRCNQLKKQVDVMQERFTNLFNRRHKYDLYTSQGFASFARLEYLISNNVFRKNKRINIRNSFLLKELMEQYVENRLSDQEIRDISKSGMWRSIWSSSRNGQQIFGKPLVCLNDEQRSLLSWSSTYDNVYESMDCPPSEVIDDDILLDGWMIFQQRKHEKERRERMGGKFDEKGNKGGEVFVPVDSVDDARRISDLNDPGAKLIKKQRMKTLAERGRVREEEFQDSQLEMRKLATQGFQRRVKSR